MKRAIQGAARLVRAAKNIWVRKWIFLTLYLLVFLASTGTLAYLDLLPEHRVVEVAQGAPVSKSTPAAPEEPIRITAHAIGLDVHILNPISTDIVTLDEALLAGAVRYPTSALLGEQGNVVLFGHSSYLPIVTNKNFKAFNNIQKFKVGDRITVTSGTRAYVYAVESVRAASAAEDGIPLVVEGAKLTLATCDSFGKKSDRFVVVAHFVESHGQDVSAK